MYRLCNYCNKKFYYNNKNNYIKKFCSNECRYKWHSETFCNKNHPSYNKITKICEICNKEYLVPQYRINSRFCGRKCFHIWHKTSQVGKDSNCWKPKIIKKCIVCEGEYYVNEARKNSRFCSHSCYSKWLKENIYGEIHPSYIDGGSIKYCHKFNEKLKIKIRDRDNNICQNCGKTKEQEGKNLTVHHLHYDKENCDPDLITLCDSCNKRANKNRNWHEMYYLRKLVYRGLAKIYNLNEIGFFSEFNEH